VPLLAPLLFGMMLKKIFNRAVLGGLAKDFVASPVRIHKLFHEYSSKKLLERGVKSNSKKHKSLSHAFASCVSVPASGFQALKGVTIATAVGVGVGLITVAASVATLFLLSPLMLSLSEKALFKLTKAESVYGMKKQGAFPSLREAWKEAGTENSSFVEDFVEENIPEDSLDIPSSPQMPQL
jgi:hypothetical protein